MLKQAFALCLTGALVLAAGPADAADCPLSVALDQGQTSLLLAGKTVQVTLTDSQKAQISKVFGPPPASLTVAVPQDFQPVAKPATLCVQKVNGALVGKPIQNMR